MAVGPTYLTNLVNPEVMADMIQAELPNLIRFSPLAEVDNTLSGRPGSVLTAPSWVYSGDASDIAEGAAIPLDQMSTSQVEFTIKKAGKGVEISDEAVLSGYGDPVGEANRQMGLAIANKVDNDALTELSGATQTYATAAGGSLTVSELDSAQQVFGDEELGDMVLIAHPKDAAVLRADAAGQWARASELGDTILKNGTFGEALGAQVVRSNKLAQGTAYLVKQGALGLYMKRDIQIEADRDIVSKMNVITADQHYGVHIKDSSKIVAITVTP